MSQHLLVVGSRKLSSASRGTHKTSQNGLRWNRVDNDCWCFLGSVYRCKVTSWIRGWGNKEVNADRFKF